MAFNTLQYDEDTKQRLNTYENIMGGYSRFWVQLIAKENGVNFKWGVTTKDSVIRMMKEEDVKIPTKADLDKYLANHRNRAEAIVAKKEPEVIGVDFGVEETIEQTVEAVDFEEEIEFEEEVDEVAVEDMKRGELVKLAFKLNIDQPMNKKNVELVDMIKEARECQKA